MSEGNKTRYKRANLDNYQLTEKLASLIPLETIQKYQFLPLEILGEEGDQTLKIAMSNPLDFACREYLRITTGLKILPLRAGKKKIQVAIRNIQAA